MKAKQHRAAVKFAAGAAKLLDDVTARAISGVLIVSFICTLWLLSDTSRFNAHGAEKPKTRSLSELRKINPDTVAWLTVDNTNIDHPVVQGVDNFEYLDLDFERQFYVGGALFLDAGCNPDLGDSYALIHGHHMAGGLMFGDLDKFLDEEFFSENSTGKLRTPDRDYRLEIIGAGKANAYDEGIYNMDLDLDTHLEALSKTRGCMRGTEKPVDKLLVLSTCTDDMDNSRTVVYCSMIPEDDKKDQ